MYSCILIVQSNHLEEFRDCCFKASSSIQSNKLNKMSRDLAVVQTASKEITSLIFVVLCKCSEAQRSVEWPEAIPIMLWIFYSDAKFPIGYQGSFTFSNIEADYDVSIYIFHVLMIENYKFILYYKLKELDANPNTGWKTSFSRR